ncbi:Ion transport 2 domain protein [Luminiphilus syltensis NOR5-1B]|uniref:Ion transport 2 domain protein n=1 Tax=Luminiphilus syltensis NOR5-1B TaxID=565045 RepID=B8KUM7_9GAMM|nr:potassium channel family protein [Luminiphilus syltensis]EED35079.1 Ion transport 2 domain protein [Luminiphilus syltensis NOR5-1B]
MTHLLLGLLLNVVTVVTTIGLHYEVLSRLYRGLPRLPLSARSRIIAGVAGAVMAHTIEVFIFAVAFSLSAKWGFGGLSGAFEGTASDYVYFSFSAFTTVGFGDISPHGQIRWLAGVESLTGFVLITWTASFLYLEMSRNWEPR